MISTTMNRLGALRCPAAVHNGSGAKSVYSGPRLRWFEQRDYRGTALRNIDLIPTPVAVTGTRVSAPPERSP
ncbi:MAG TPA: hypothetical protein VGD67_10915 [Pseudonocardiaceae bacterium]